MSAKKRQLRGHRGVETSVVKPKCREHRMEMFFNVARSVWECPEVECKMVAHPPNDVGGARSVSFSPPFELLHVVDSDNNGSDHFILRKDKVHFDITDIVASHTTRGGQDAIVIVPNEWLNIDQFGNARQE